MRIGYKPSSKFFTTLNRGFSVEVGTPSMSTLESFQHTVAPADQWPVSDAWAYHDWHQSGNGDVAPFMQEIATEFGEPTSLADFERKAQMLNYVDHRAIFEGFNAHLWAPNSGRLLWMTQPAWPSTMWQIFSSDYDTQASFYGVKSAAEPVHVQMKFARPAGCEFRRRNSRHSFVAEYRASRCVGSQTDPAASARWGADPARLLL